MILGKSVTITSKYSLTSLRTCIFCNNAVRTSNLRNHLSPICMVLQGVQSKAYCFMDFWIVYKIHSSPQLCHSAVMSFGSRSLKRGPWQFLSWLRGLDSAAGTQVFEDVYSNNKWSRTVRQGIMRMLAFCEETLKEKSLSCQDSVLDLLRSCSGTLCITTCVGERWRWWSDDATAVQEELPPPPP